MRARDRRWVAAGAGAVTLILLVACTAGTDGVRREAEPILVGTADPLGSLDPALDGSRLVRAQVFPTLVAYDDGGAIVPDAASAVSFTSDTELTITMREGLDWADGNDLTSSDVAFTLERLRTLADPAKITPLAAIEEIDTPDQATVVLRLTEPSNRLLEFLTTVALVDEEVFPADATLTDAEIIDANAFGGAYTVASRADDGALELLPNPDHQGARGAARNDGITLQPFADSSGLAAAVADGRVDVAADGLTRRDIRALREDEDVVVAEAPGETTRSLVFDVDAQPFGAQSAAPDEAQALAVRQAVAELVDRAELADRGHGSGGYAPLYSPVPAGLEGAAETFREEHGDADGGPDAAAAAELLAAAGVPTPVALTVQYLTDDGGSAEFRFLRTRLEADGLFDVDLMPATTESASQDRAAGTIDAYQQSWQPEVYGLDGYLTALLLIPGVSTGGASLDGEPADGSGPEPDTADLLRAQAAEPDPGERMRMIEEIQAQVAESVPLIPLLQDVRVAVSGAHIDGVVLPPGGPLWLAELSD